MTVTKSEAEKCLLGLEDTIEILLQQNLHRNIQTLCCIIVVLQEYITCLLPLFEPVRTRDIATEYAPDYDTQVCVELETGRGCGVVLGDMGEELEYRICVKQLVEGSIAEKCEDIEIDHIVLGK